MKSEYETWKTEIEHGPRSGLFGVVVVWFLMVLGISALCVPMLLAITVKH